MGILIACRAPQVHLEIGRQNAGEKLKSSLDNKATLADQVFSHALALYKGSKKCVWRKVYASRLDSWDGGLNP